MTEVTLLSAGMARALHHDIQDESGPASHYPAVMSALQSIASGTVVCLPVSALREIMTDMATYGKAWNDVPPALLLHWASKIEKLLPAKEG